MLFLICSYALFKRKNKPSKSAECVSILLLVTNTADDVAQIRLLHVSALVTSHHQVFKMHEERQLNTAHYNDTFSDS